MGKLGHMRSRRRDNFCDRKILGRIFTGLINAIALPVLIAVTIIMGGTALAGFTVQNNTLLDGNGVPFIMRGVNHPHVWYADKTEQVIADIAGAGANAVRIVLGSGKQWGPTPASEVADIIRQLKENSMIAVLEVHDCTGYGEKEEAAPISSAVDYWLSIKNVLKGQEDYVIINIANEPLGNNVATTSWANAHMQAIYRLRKAGLTHTLMVDAANWGQDWEQIMLNDAPQVFSSDPQKNIVFSVHMYQVYGDYNTVKEYMSTFVKQLKLPLVVGEFGADHQGEDVDEAAIMQLADRYRIGYLGWSWSGNSGGGESLDITRDFNADNLTSWGDFLINSTYGIRRTSEPASVFGDNDAETPTSDSQPQSATSFPGCGESPPGCGS